jgi:hypothetical protein
MSPMPLRDLRARAAKGPGQPREGTLAERLLRLLQEDREQAWRAVELARRTRADIHTVGTTLRRLRTRGLIDLLDEHWFALDDQEVAQRQAFAHANRAADERLGKEHFADWMHPQRRFARSGKND